MIRSPADYMAEWENGPLDPRTQKKKKKKNTACKPRTASAYGRVVNNLDIEDVTSFKYLSSVINIMRGKYVAHLILSKHLEIQGNNNNHPNKNFNSNVKSVLLYGSEIWRMIEETLSKLRTFINRCLRRILRTHLLACHYQQRLHVGKPAQGKHL